MNGNTLAHSLLCLLDDLSGRPAFLSIRRGLFIVLPLVMIGSFTVLLRNLPSEEAQRAVDALLGPVGVRACDNLISATFDIAALALVCALGGANAMRASMISPSAPTISPMLGSIVVLSCFFVIIAPEETGSWAISFSMDRGLLLAMVVSMSSSSVFVRLASYRRFHLPEEVAGYDPVVRDVVMIMPAAVVTIFLFALIRLILTFYGITDLQLVTSRLLALPFLHSGDGLGFGLLYSTASQVLWFFGAHGPNVLNAVDVNILTPAGLANAKATMLATSPPYIFTKVFFDTFTRMGGSGSTMALCLAVFVRGRDRGIKKLCLLALVPALCNVNEPLIFGIPLVLNPAFAIPFLLVPAVQTIVAYAATILGFLPHTSIGVAWTTPPLFSGYAAVGGLSGTVVQIINLALGFLIYLPFVTLSDAVREKHGKQVMQTLLEVASRCESGSPGTHKCLTLPGEVGRLAHTLAHDLDRALNAKENQMYLVFQPQCNHASGRVVGVEALLRWDHPVYGPIAPPITIALAEDMNRIDRLGQFILSEACKQRAAWSAAVPSDLVIAVNITPRQLRNAGFAKMVLDTLHSQGLKPTQLELEITESSILEPDAHTLDLLTRLRVLGVRLAIDDFGMGHTSLRYLRAFPVTTVKVDRSLTESLNSNVQEQIVRSILDLSRSLHITTVVEGVEDERQLRVFTEIGYETFQGYYFSQPLPGRDCLDFVRSFNGQAADQTPR
ncbi:EAL domain-containing protein [Desulfovibrio desulfuricans]|uniref:EAL domain-containing protein n=1 Tax=Desulfovibrio desulfuricans TaxID=876 RepID=UPI0035B4C288